MNIPRIIKIHLISISVLLGLLLPKSTYASDIVENFYSEIKVNKSSQAEITETIEYNFGLEQRHGIYRDIPFIYRNKDNIPYQVEIKIVSVTDRNGSPYKYSLSNEGENRRIKIGDPNSTISGINTYVIKYKMLGAVTYFSDHDEFYWNITGTWPGPVNKVRSQITVDVPGAVIEDQICFTGVYGSTSQNCEIASKENSVIVVSKTVLNPGEQISADIKIPKGLLDFYEIKKVEEHKPNKLLGMLFAAYVFVMNILAPALIALIWFFKGRDPKDDKLTIRMYDPPKLPSGEILSPIEVGAVVDETVNPRDISAEIINLAIKKYLKIVEKDEKSLIFTNRKLYFQRGQEYNKDPGLAKLNEYQKTLFTALNLHYKEETSLDEIKLSFPPDIYDLKVNVYKDITAKGLFKENPDSVRTKFYGFGVALIFILGIVPSIMMFIIAKFMPSKTLEGVKARKHALGLKLFLESQDDQLKFQEQNFYFFEKLLPYAIVFGVAKQWAEKFSGLTNYNPDWYTSTDLNNLSTLVLIDRLQENMSTIQSGYTATTTTSTGGFSSGFGGGGGGFSGGGFGGGGGGSW